MPWSFIDKYGATSPQTGELLEVGADLNLLFGGNAPHYVSFLTETRSSNSPNSTLSDFALGSVNTIGTGYKVKTGQYTNTVTVTGIDRGTNTTLVATDANSHFGVAAQIQVQKAVNAVNPLSPTAAEDANSAPGVYLPAGASVTWTYLVTNPGNVALEALSLVDDAGLNPIRVSGDANNNGLLDPGETWLYRSVGTVNPGQHTGFVTATARDLLLHQTVTAKDAGNYFGSAPGTRIVTAINATIPSNPTGIEDANAAPGPAFVNGTSAVWTYQVFNTGNVALSLTSLKDNNGTTNITTDDFSPAPVLSSGYNAGDINRNNLLDTTETWLYSSQGVKTYTVRSGQYSNIGTVTVRDPNTNQMVTVSDVNYHWGQANGEGLTPSFWKTNADSNGAVAWPRSPDRTGPLVYSPTQLLSTVFTLPSSLGLSTVTLNGALGLTGTTGANALMRSAVAALLNATHPRVAYPLTARQVIDKVNTALAGNTNGMNTLQTTLNGYNNLGSDLAQSGNTNGPLLAAGLPGGVQAGESLLTQAQLTPIVAEALARWATVTGLPALKPEDVHVAIADLPDGSNGQLPMLGYTTDGTVLIDVNAGGFGWFVDHTPGQNEEFSGQLAQGGLAATSSSEAYGKMDLLTVVSHEIGHLLGFEHSYDDNGLKLMDATLAAGVRELPASAETGSLEANAESVNGAMAAGAAASKGVSYFDAKSGEFVKANQPIAPTAKKGQDEFLVVMDQDSNKSRHELYELKITDDKRVTPAQPLDQVDEIESLVSRLKKMAARISGKK